MGKDTGSIRTGRSGVLSVGNRDGLSVRVISSDRRNVTVQFLRPNGETGITQTYRRTGMKLRPFNDRERAIYNG